jgi:uncharacterized membrane protein HdeD (DUF308 family)
MLDQLIDRWWIIAARGAVAVIFGVAAFLAPHTTMRYLVSLFGLFAIADGIFTIGAGLAISWLTLFLEGVVGGSIGLLTLLFPVAAAMWFAYFIVAWAFVTGALELVAAYGLWHLTTRLLSEGEWLLGVSGVLSVVFGTVIALWSTTNVTQFMWTVGTYALLSGALLVVLAFNIRTWPRTV